MKNENVKATLLLLLIFLFGAYCGYSIQYENNEKEMTRLLKKKLTLEIQIMKEEQKRDGL
jgi:hypothetical protein